MRCTSQTIATLTDPWMGALRTAMLRSRRHVMMQSHDASSASQVNTQSPIHKYTNKCSISPHWTAHHSCRHHFATSAGAYQPIYSMSKRKYSSDAALPRKKAKLAQVHEFEEYDTLVAPSPPLSQTMPSRREKRKRTDLSHIDSDDEPSAKRAKIDQSSNDARNSSRSSSLEPWPSIGYAPEEEKEPSALVEEFYKSCTETEVACSCETQTIYRNPLPSPEPSERDTSDVEAIEQTSIHTTHQMQCPVSKLQPVSPPNTSSPRRKNRSSRRRIERRSPVSSHQEQPRQQRRKKKNEDRSSQQDGKPTPTVEEFLQSKRSSRRDSKCDLWYLSDNGTASAIRCIRR